MEKQRALRPALVFQLRIRSGGRRQRRSHSFRSGVCSKCGYSNGSGGGGGGGGNVCYHSSTRTSWSGCDWYEYCRSCGALVDYGTSHGTYVYGAWEYYSSSQHRRSYACSDCGEGTYRYASHSVSTQYAQYSAAQHRTVQSCSVCNATLSSSYSAHTFTYGSWQSDSATQHRRTKTCSACGYSEYEYAAHSLTAGAWRPTRARTIPPPQAAALLRLRVQPV